MSRLLALFESIYIPIEWNIDNFDLYLDPGTAPASFIHWLAGWFDIAFDPTWSEAQRRLLLKEAGTIYARRGTKWSLSRVLEIYLGKDPEILEFTKDLEPFTFRVKIPIREKDTNRMLIEKVIDINKPAHTTYMIDFKK
jgi:phage tail-like protein